MRERGALHGFFGEVGAEAAGVRLVGFVDVDGGETDAVDGDAVADLPAAGELGSGDAELKRSLIGVAGKDGADGFDEAGERRNRLQRSRPRGQGPGVAEVAGDADVFRAAVGEGGALRGLQLLLQDVGRDDALREGDGVYA